MKKRKKRYVILGVIFVLLTGVVLYNIYDNHRFVVTKQDIWLAELPEAFDGYQILQISDLHGENFGEHQEDLCAAINDIAYDCVVFTGDMNKYEESDPLSSQAILDLLNGLEHKNTALWVDGNTGPFTMEAVDGSYTGRLTEMGETIEQAGVEVLDAPVEITRDGTRIWFVPELCETEIQMNYLSIPEDQFQNPQDYQSIVSYGQSLQNWYEQLNHNGEVKIRVNHFPIQANLTQESWDALGYLDYHLSIAGHYHGGQIRLPLIGALYIPSPTSGLLNGYFPNQNEVKGLQKILDMQQYVSAGLGSSATIPFLDFRFFNTPEINLITLHTQG